MICPVCHSHVPDDSEFCPACHTNLTVPFEPGLSGVIPGAFCPSCGARVAPAAEQCPKCGYALPGLSVRRERAEAVARAMADQVAPRKEASGQLSLEQELQQPPSGEAADAEPPDPPADEREAQAPPEDAAQEERPSASEPTAAPELPADAPAQGAVQVQPAPIPRRPSFDSAIPSERDVTYEILGWTGVSDRKLVATLVIAAACVVVGLTLIVFRPWDRDVRVSTPDADLSEAGRLSQVDKLSGQDSVTPIRQEPEQVDETVVAQLDATYKRLGEIDALFDQQLELFEARLSEDEAARAGYAQEVRDAIAELDGMQTTLNEVPSSRSTILSNDLTNLKELINLLRARADALAEAWENTTYYVVPAAGLSMVRTPLDEQVNPQTGLNRYDEQFSALYEDHAPRYGVGV